jgi:hypothetical protein
MHRIKSQLCEVFKCTNQQLTSKGNLDKFRAWLKEHPEIEASSNPYSGEMINGEIAVKFFEFYKNKKAKK